MADRGATRLVRGGRNGASVHLSGCRYAARGRFVPWVWAEGLDDDDWLRKGWFKPCKVCLPDQAKRLAEARRAASTGSGRSAPA